MEPGSRVQDSLIMIRNSYAMTVHMINRRGTIIIFSTMKKKSCHGTQNGHNGVAGLANVFFGQFKADGSKADGSSVSSGTVVTRTTTLQMAHMRPKIAMTRMRGTKKRRLEMKTARNRVRGPKSIAVPRKMTEIVFFLFYSFLLLSPARGTIVLSSSVHMSAYDSFYFSFFIFNLFVTPNLWFFSRS
jgi:hypothetical protein